MCKGFEDLKKSVCYLMYSFIHVSKAACERRPMKINKKPCKYGV